MILIIVYSVVMLALGLLFLVDYIRSRAEVRRYALYGVVCGLALLVLDSAMVPLIPKFWSATPLYRLLAMDLLAFLRMFLFASVGMLCCAELGIAPFPLLRRRDEGGGRFAASLLGVVLATALLAAGYSAVLFHWAEPQLSDLMKGLSETQMARYGIANGPSLLAALAVLEFAFAEEIVFRLGIQNFLASRLRLGERRYWMAVVVTALLWSLGHGGVLEPGWVKLVQVFPIGLALGYLFRKYGTGACILAHGLFNVIMLLLQPSLLPV